MQIEYFAWVRCCIAAMSVLVGTAHGTNAQYSPPKPVLVVLQFEGSPAFPRLTVVSDTTGLARFTGSAFGLSQGQRNQVVNRIRELLQEDYRDFNVRFVIPSRLPSLDGPVPGVYTWGIDDSALLASRTGCDNPDANLFRLFGIAGGRGGAVDCDGRSIAHPRHARTWAGSFALPPGGPVTSQPSLAIGGTLPAGARVTVEHIAQALANSAAHEIGHMFGLRHINGCDGPCASERLMQSAPEAIEATRNKVFNESEQGILREVIGPRPTIRREPRGSVLDIGTGLMWTMDARLARRVAVPGVTAAGDGALNFSDARAYADGLDYLGYNDWRLPLAFDANLSVVCQGLLGRVGRGCIGSGELLRLDRELRPSVHFFELDRRQAYWSNTALGQEPKVYDFRTYHAVAAGSAAQVWPVRDAVRLIDNGDGTVTDRAQNLMWLKRPLQPRFTRAGPTLMTRAEALDAVRLMRTGGHSDWRLPRIASFSDATCDDDQVFAPEPDAAVQASAGCAQNELAKLFHGWGVRSGRAGSAPLVLDSAGTPLWFEPETFPERHFTFSFLDGVLRRASQDARAAVLPVRFLARNELVSQANAVADPHPNVVVRFNRVMTGGLLDATPAFRQPRIGFGVRRVYSIRSNATFDTSPGAVQVCLRYNRDDFVLGLPVSQAELRVGQENTSGTFVRLPVLPGYPDSTNQVVCGISAGLGRFMVMGPGDP